MSARWRDARGRPRSCSTTAVARSFEGREVVVDASEGDPQPDSFSCEAELGYRFFLDRLPGI